MQTPQTQDPHGYEEEGTRRAWAYLFRQLWQMRYVTLVLVTIMAGYSVTTKQWIPFIDGNIINFFVFFMIWWAGTNALTKLSIAAVQGEKVQHSSLPIIYKRMGTIMWTLYATNVIGTYWAICIIAATFLGK